MWFLFFRATTATPIHQVEPNYQNPMPQVLNQSSFVVHKMLLHSISFLSPRFLAETSHPSWLVTATFTISMSVSMPMPWQIWSLLKLHSFQPSQISNIQVMHRFSMSPPTGLQLNLKHVWKKRENQPISPSWGNKHKGHEFFRLP